jgi:hypothetical protein
LSRTYRETSGDGDQNRAAPYGGRYTLPRSLPGAWNMPTPFSSTFDYRKGKHLGRSVIVLDPKRQRLGAANAGEGVDCEQCLVPAGSRIAGLVNGGKKVIHFFDSDRRNIPRFDPGEMKILGWIAEYPPRREAPREERAVNALDPVHRRRRTKPPRSRRLRQGYDDTLKIGVPDVSQGFVLKRSEKPTQTL